MQLIKTIFLAGLFFFIGQQVFAQNDYVTIAQSGTRPNFIFISNNGESYKKNKLDNDEVENGKEYNYTTVLKFVRKYEKKGYKMVTSNYSENVVYFLMRKEED